MTHAQTPIRATRHASIRHSSACPRTHKRPASQQPACGATPQCAADGQGRAGRAGEVRFLRLVSCPAAAPEVCHVVVGLSRRCRRPGAAPPVVCCSKDLISKVGGVDSKDSSDLGFCYLFYKF